MNYARIYDELIANVIGKYGRPHNNGRAQKRPFKYAVMHHIIPVSWWSTPEQGTRAIRTDYSHEANAVSNLCWMSPREHWIAHLCLALTHGGAEWIAVEKMSAGVNDAAQGIRPNSRLVELAVINGREANRRISAARVADDPDWPLRHITPDVIARRAETTRQVWENSPKMREAAGKRALEFFHSPEAQAKRAASLQTDEFREYKRQETADKWQDPESRARRMKAIKEAHQRPEVKARKSEATKARWASGEMKPCKEARAIIGTHKETGEEIQYHSMTSAKKAGFNEGNISQVLNGKKMSAAGYYWRWADEDPAIQQERIAKSQHVNCYIGEPVAGGENISFVGTKALIAAGFGQSNVTACVKGKSNTHKGYRWRLATAEDSLEAPQLGQ